MDAGARGEKLWEPSPEAVEQSQMTEYMRWLAAERDLDFEGDYSRLWEWSVGDLEAFWRSIWDYFDVAASGDPGAILASRAMPGAEWFGGTTLNYAEHLFRGRASSDLAIQHASELRELGSLTWDELRAQVAEVAAGLRGLGVGPGDRVVGYLPN